MSDADLIDRMEAVRAANNVNWMALVKLALEVAPERARPILAGITAKDAEIAGIIKQLAEPR